jgi:hypothetical protein
MTAGTIDIALPHLDPRHQMDHHRDFASQKTQKRGEETQ